MQDAEPDAARAVMARAFGNLYGFSSVQGVEIRSRDAGGREFLRTAQIVRRGSAGGPNRMLVRLLGPGDIRGIGILLMERADFSYDAFLFQPALGRIRRISVAQRRDPFFGTDIAFEDLETRRADQWRARRLREEKWKGRDALVIELAADGFPSSYEKIVAWFDREIPVILRAEFYRGGRRFKELEVDPSRIVEVEGYFVPSRMIFRTPGGTETVVEVRDIRIRERIPEKLFTKSALQFGDDGWDVRILSDSK